jgi:hypothetical protein
MWTDILAAGMNITDNIFARQWQNLQNKRMRAWMENMSNTAHQREITDLRRAGLNPILSAKYGGASTPGASGVGAPSGSNPGSAWMQARQAREQAELLKEQQKTEKTKQDQNKADKTLKETQAGKAATDAYIQGLKAGQAEWNNQLFKSQTGQMLDIFQKLGGGKNPGISGHIKDIRNLVTSKEFLKAIKGMKNNNNINNSSAKGVKKAGEKYKGRIQVLPSGRVGPMP